MKKAEAMDRLTQKFPLLIAIALLIACILGIVMIVCLIRLAGVIA